MSIVIEHLKEVINGESNAKRKYELYAERAKEENLPEVAHLFKAISTAEAIHIKNHVRALEVITKSEVKIEDIVKVNLETLKLNTKDITIDQNLITRKYFSHSNVYVPTSDDKTDVVNTKIIPFEIKPKKYVDAKTKQKQ